MTYDKEKLLKMLSNAPLYIFHEGKNDEFLNCMDYNFHNHYNYAHGATKLVIIPIDQEEDYVIKIPYTGSYYYESGYYTSYTILPSQSEYCDFVAAGEPNYWDYCAREAERYILALQKNLSKYQCLVLMDAGSSLSRFAMFLLRGANQVQFLVRLNDNNVRNHFKTLFIMKKIEGIAINRSNSSRIVDLSALKESGKSRDNLILLKNDLITIPEDMEIRVDSFTPKGGQSTDYYLITIKVNDTIYDATMTSFRRSKNVTDEELEKALASEPNRMLFNLGDDEQRAVYLRGKTFKVVNVVRLKSRWDDGRFVTIPILEIA